MPTKTLLAATLSALAFGAVLCRCAGCETLHGLLHEEGSAWYETAEAAP